MVSYSQCNVLTGHHCVLEIIWLVISWYLSYHLSFQKNMGVLNFFLCVYNYCLFIRFRFMFMVFDATFFSYIVVVKFIVGGNRRTQRKSPTCRKSPTNFYHIMLYWVHLVLAGFKFIALVVICLIAQVVVNPTTIRLRPWQPL